MTAVQSATQRSALLWAATLGLTLSHGLARAEDTATVMAALNGVPAECRYLKRLCADVARAYADVVSKRPGSSPDIGLLRVRDYLSAVRVLEVKHDRPPACIKECENMLGKVKAKADDFQSGKGDPPAKSPGKDTQRRSGGDGPCPLNECVGRCEVGDEGDACRVTCTQRCHTYDDCSAICRAQLGGYGDAWFPCVQNCLTVAKW